eukprot:211019_1
MFVMNKSSIEHFIAERVSLDICIVQSDSHSMFSLLRRFLPVGRHDYGIKLYRYTQRFHGISNDCDKVDHLLNCGPSVIRNFAIIAHIDHGKSTLSDALLEVCGNIKHKVSLSGENAQSLDTLSVERERGITVKAQGASLFYNHNDQGYMLNLIDTPGHVDFSYEVSRSLAACDAVLLLVDSSQGIQAQTLATYEMATLRDLVTIPVLTKIDLPNAEVDKTMEEICDLLEFDMDDVILTSSKTGQGIESVLQAIIERVPPPTCDATLPPRLLLYDSFWTEHRGVASLVYVKEGCLRTGDTVGLYHSNQKYTVQECGVMMPHLHPVDTLYAGQVGYFFGNIRNPREIKIGDTVYLTENRKHHTSSRKEAEQSVVPKSDVAPMGDVEETKCMVFACLYPSNASQFDVLETAIEKLKLTDASVQSIVISNEALGSGFRCGFLGVLHMEVFRQRIEEESGLDVIIAAPSITYRAKLKANGDLINIDTPEEYPADKSQIECFYQPMVRATIICEKDSMNEVNYLCNEYDGIEEEIQFMGIDYDRIIYKYRFPLSSIVGDFYTKLKSVSHGHASFDYEECGWDDINLVQVRILINKKSIGPLSVLCDQKRAYTIGKELCQRLGKSIHRQLYEVNIQAVADGKIVSKVRLQPFRKDVLIKAGKVLGTGDPSRKKKLLNAQKEGKKRMKEIGKVKIPQEAFMQVLKTK